MRTTGIFILVAIAGVTGWLAPALTVPDKGRAAAVPAPVRAEADSPRVEAGRTAWLAGDTILRRAPDGHFYADATIEGRSMRLLVDTGASMVALSGEDARAAGLEWNDADLVPVGRGASGDVFGVPLRLSRIELGGIEARDVEAVIVPYGLDVSLLGQSFLGRVNGVRIEDDRMVLN
jgi:aspartyl protease family protein